MYKLSNETGSVVFDLATLGKWVSRFLASKNIPAAPQPPYSPDLSPCDFFFFPKLKNYLKGHPFGTLENIQTAVTHQLKTIPLSELHQCYEEWKKFLQPCVASEGSYFEGDNIEFCQVIYSQFGLAIHQNDHQARRRFVEWAQNEIAVVPDFHKRILFSDEAHFWLNGYVNKQNCRIWSEANPQVYVETPLHPEKLTVWCALWAGGILLQKR
ncbi:putative transposase [Trichonephila clavipes]|nr:putative transposase [Trichonephila clavipes]